MGKNHKSELTVSVGIPTYNEEANIKNLLLSLLDQEQTGFKFKEIIVISDGSTDRTEQEVTKVKDNRIKLIREKTRMGKVYLMNKLFSTVKSDIFVQLDGDISLKDKKVIFHLISPFIKDNSTSLVLGNHLPLTPTNFVEKLAYFGVEIWNVAIKSLESKGLRYHVTGQIRAFSREFSTNFRLPIGIYSSEDVFSFYWAKQNDFKVVYSPKAIVYFRLPSNYFDYKNQMKRFLKTSSYMKSYFGETMFKKYNTMTSITRLNAFLKILLKEPKFIALCYLFLQVISRLASVFHKQIPLWEIASSSKKLNYVK